MSTTLSIQEAQAQLPELVARAVKDAEPCYIKRNGKTVAVLVSAREWRRRTKDNGHPQPAAASAKAQERYRRVLSKRLDALGPEYHLSKEKQARAEELLAKNAQGSLTRAERRELNALLRECEALMLRRAEAIDKMP